MKNSPESPKPYKPMTPEEIGRLSPRVPPKPVPLEKPPEPEEYIARDKEGNPIEYLPKSTGDIFPNTLLKRKEDKRTPPQTLRYKGITKETSQIVLEEEDGSAFTIPQEALKNEYEKSEPQNPFEQTLRLKEQYESQISIFRKLGILERLSNNKEGIKGIDGKEYPVPTLEEIAERMTKTRERQELLETKTEQGFTRLLLVPFGMSLDQLIAIYKQVILNHHHQGKLFATKENPQDPDELLVLDANQPVWVWEKYANADASGELIYFPKEFSQNHQARTKQEILKEEGGWNIILIEDLPNIPREGKGKEKAGRKQLEANKTPLEYLATLGKDFYQDETGMTPEDQLTYAILYLEETNQVIDDWQGKGSISYQLGSYFKKEGLLPCARWDRGDRRARLGRALPGARYDYYGVRGSVRV